MEIIRGEQRTKEWFELKRGKLSASHAQTIATGGKGLITLCYELIADFYSNVEKETYTNDDMQRGNELEEVARALYEQQTGLNVSEISCVTISDYTLASPDGVIFDENDNIIKSIEIKCPKDSKYINVLLNNYIDPAYYWQMTMQAYCLGTRCVDYVVYNPHFDKDLIIIPFEVKEEDIEKLKLGIAIGEKILTELHSNMKGVLNV